MKISWISENIRSTGSYFDERWLSPTYAGKSGFVYRGMNIDEFQSAKSTGIIQSKGYHNYPGQEGGTCYGSFSDAEHYGIESDIYDINSINYDYKHDTPRNKPYIGAIIEIPRKYVLSPEEDKRVHHNEFMHFGPLPFNIITRAWLLTPIAKNNKVYYKRHEIPV